MSRSVLHEPVIRVNGAVDIVGVRPSSDREGEQADEGQGRLGLNRTGKPELLSPESPKSGGTMEEAASAMLFLGNYKKRLTVVAALGHTCGACGNPSRLFSLAFRGGPDEWWVRLNRNSGDLGGGLGRVELEKKCTARKNSPKGVQIHTQGFQSKSACKHQCRLHGVHWRTDAASRSELGPLNGIKIHQRNGGTSREPGNCPVVFLYSSQHRRERVSRSRYIQVSKMSTPNWKNRILRPRVFLDT